MSPVLLDYMKTGMVIGYLMDNIQQPSVLETNSNGTLTSYIHMSLALYLEYNSHIQMCNLVHGSMISLSSKKNKSEKVTLKAIII